VWGICAACFDQMPLDFQLACGSSLRGGVCSVTNDLAIMSSAYYMFQALSGAVPQCLAPVGCFVRPCIVKGKNPGRLAPAAALE
jgi:hypothetical protein